MRRNSEKRISKKRIGMKRDRSESGVALIMVVVVLMALVVIATPFTISMRNQSRDSRERFNQERARLDCALLRNVVLERLKDTHPDLDYMTPHSDDASEWSFDPRDMPFALEEGGSLKRISSARVADQQGLINLNSASIYLMANLFGSRTVLVEDAEADASAFLVRSTDDFPEEGMLWIEGEAAVYASKTEDAFEDVERAMETANLEVPVAGGHPTGAEVIDYRSFLLATYCYKWQTAGLASFSTVESLRNIAVYGEEALDRAALDSVADLLTVRSGLPGGRRFLNPQPVLGTAEGAAGPVVMVPNGRYMGAGTIVRLRTDDWTHYSMVLRSVSVDDASWAVMLQEPVPFDIRNDDAAVLEAMARHPVNVNTAPVEVITACLTGLGLAGQSQRVHADEALIIAERICSTSLKGWLELDALLAALAAEDDKISAFHRQVVMMNALDASDAYVTGGTAPFTFETAGYFEVETAVALDFAESGREAGRHFVREILRAAPRHPVMHLFHTQAAFEEQRRLAHGGRWYTTLPSNMNPPDGINQPPSPLRPYIEGIEPSGEHEESAVRLAPLRTPGDRVLHFDTVEYMDIEEESAGKVNIFGDEDGESTAGSDATESAADEMISFGHKLHENPDGFVTGEDVIRLSVFDPPISLLGGAYARVWPFSVEMWYRFDETGAEHYIFDSGMREESDRIYLFHDGQKLRFRVADVSEPVSGLDEDSPLEHAEISYDFADLGLEPGVFYHIACMATGTRPSDLCLFVDGVPRGKRTFQTRLKSPLDLATPPQIGEEAPLVGDPMTRIKVEDASMFPRRGVLRVGHERIEYIDRDEDTFFVQFKREDRFGGRTVRQSASQDHPETEIVELYGYSSLLDSEVVPQGKVLLGEELNRFLVARVKNEDVDKDIINVYLSNGETRTIGEGFDIATVSTLPVAGVDKLELPEGVFQESGGFAVVFSDTDRRNLDTITLEGSGGNQGELNFERLDSDRPQTVDGNKLVNGFAVIEYSSYSNGELTGVNVTHPDGQPTRAAPYLNDVNLNPDGERWNPSIGEVDMSSTPQFLRPRVFWTDVDSGIFNNVDDVEVEQPAIFVVPISVAVAGGSGSVFEDFWSGDSEGDTLRPELVQISRDFDGQGDDDTEWFRYDTVVLDRFVRDYPGPTDAGPKVSGGLRRMYEELEQYCFRDVTPDPETVAHEVNREIRFRAQNGTIHSTHSAGQYVLPVFRTEIIGMSFPGRHDDITIVDDEGDRESARINYATHRDVDHDGKAIIGLQEVVLGIYRKEFEVDEATLAQQIESPEEGATEEALITKWNLEARDYTRIVKFPSGELPTNPPEEFILGGNLFGDPSPSRGCIDEVRFGSFDTPHPALPRFPRYALKEELEEEEGSVLELSTNTLVFNAYRLQDLLLEEFEILKQIPPDASLLLIGDEIIACAEIDTEEGYVTIMPEGRGLFGTEPGYHRNGDPVVVLNFPAVSALEEDARAESEGLFVVDPDRFPFAGAVLVDQEVIGYDRTEDKMLSMPSYKPYGEGKPRGLFRGRFGTEPADHFAGTLVYALPVRYPDRYVPGSDAPELAHFSLGVDAPGAFFSEVNWIEMLQAAGGVAPVASTDPLAAVISGNTGAGADIVVLVRVGDRPPWDGDPANTDGLFLFEDPGGPEGRNFVLRQGDRIECRVFTRYGARSFDALDFASNAWKYAPLLEALSIESVEPSRVFRHEEWR